MVVTLERQSQSGLNVTKRVLIYRLLMLEQSRHALEKELRAFTGKANDAVQDFLNMSDEKAAQNCTELATTLNLRCRTINQLATFFQELKVGIEPSCGLKVIPLTESLSPCLQTTPVTRLTCGSREMRISDLLHFGPMLQNALMATSITNAVQTFGSMLSLRHIRASLFSHSELALCSASSRCELSTEVCESLSEAYREGKPAVIDFKREGLYLPQRPRFCPSLKGSLEDSHAAPVKKGHSMVQQMTLQFPDWEQGNFVQHQKLTASQLIHFIRSSSDAESLVQVTFFKGKRLKSAEHQGATDERVSEEESKLPVSIRKQQFPSLAPVFKRKPNLPAGSPIYSCIVASKCELWDVADIFTDDARFLLERPLEPEESPVNCCSESYFEVLGVSQQEPSSTSLSQLPSNISHNAPSMMQVQKNRNSTAFKIPEFRIRKFEEMEVIVSHLVSPSDFSVQHVSSELQKLSHLMGSLKSHSSLAQMHCVPDIGSCVAGWYPEHQSWCRAQVLRICGMQAETSQTVGDGGSTGVCEGGSTKVCGGHIELELRRIDFGDTARLPLYHLRELDEQMAAVPQQALQVALANVSPSSGTEWTPDAVSWFKGKVMGRTLYARLYPQRKNVRIELFMEKGKIGAMRRGSSLSLQLAQNGHAHHDDLKRSKGSVLQSVGGKASQWERRLVSCYPQDGRV